MGRDITKFIHIFLMLFVLFSAKIVFAEDITSYECKENKCLKVSLSQKLAVELKSNILYYAQDENNLYYLRKEILGEKKSFIFGVIEKVIFEAATEKVIPITEITSFKKVVILNKIIYLHTEQNNLFFINTETMQYSKEINLLDFSFIGGQFYYLKNKDAVVYLHCGNENIKLNLTGNVVFSKIIDSRMLFLSSGDQIELFDLKKFSHVYLYSKSMKYKIPDNFNFLISSHDISDQVKANDIVFFKVYINGREVGRTTTGLSQIVKNFKDMLTPGVHVVSLVRWQLDKVKKKYRRVNNILQPKPFKITIPENRIVEIKVIYKKQKYNVSSSFVSQ